MSSVGLAAAGYFSAGDFQRFQSRISFIIQDMGALGRSCSGENSAGLSDRGRQPRLSQAACVLPRLGTTRYSHTTTSHTMSTNHSESSGQYRFVIRSAKQAEIFLWSTQRHESGEIVREQNRRPRSRRRNMWRLAEEVRHRRDCSDSIKESSSDETLGQSRSTWSPAKVAITKEKRRRSSKIAGTPDELQLSRTRSTG